MFFPYMLMRVVQEPPVPERDRDGKPILSYPIHHDSYIAKTQTMMSKSSCLPCLPHDYSTNFDSLSSAYYRNWHDTVDQNFLRCLFLTLY